jgi:nitric oxide reductase subunit B
MRLPGDMVFIVFGSVPLFIAAVKGWWLMRADGGDSPDRSR